ncbi:right-handed parallel beta-helix repeat-containing protein [Schlesneria sp. DSM 10557]|uniref:right-handed parallel beta-helix repeat-containing protein n=1 Tax=Schlesneria sp. DSM 10557 TaxID=3044399 RepID=UPI00359F4FBA
MATKPKVFYCDPIKGSSSGDGSRSRPWGTLEAVVKARLVNGADPAKGAVHAGDTIKLMSGDHGRPVLQGPEFAATDVITVEALDGHQPVMSQMTGTGLTNWTFRGLAVQLPDVALPKWSMVWRLTDVTGVTVEDCDIRTAADATTWTDREWEARCPWYGLWIRGTEISVRKNRLYGLENCVFVEGDRIAVDSNTIEYFINDGIQHSASNLKITRNRITDLYDLKSNQFHHDGMQGWNFAHEPLRNVLIEGNFVAYSTGKYKSIPPIGTATFQGIAVFDGTFAHFVVRDNVVMATAPHGIGLYGMNDCVIENNTVLYQGDPSRSPCWIGVFPRRASEGGADPENVVVRNNISPTYNLAANGVEAENNFAFQAPPKPWNKFAVVDPAKTFKRYDLTNAAFDLTVREDSPAAGRIVRIGGAGAQQ